MHKIFKSFIIASAMITSSTMVTTAQAQVSGVGVVSPEASIASAKALSDAYKQIEVTYKAQLDEITGREQTIINLRKQLDTNSDNQLSQEETNANPTVVQQIQAENGAIDNLSVPIALAQMFALQQIAAQYPTAQQQVITEKQINMLLSQNSILYVSQTINVEKEITNISQAVVDKLNILIPFANTNVPQSWQPSRSTQALYQQIQQIRLNAARQQAQAAQGQQQPAETPAQQQPAGR